MINDTYTHDSFIKRWRAQRMQTFLRLVHPPRRARIIDIGGTEYNWLMIDHDFQITLLNLPGNGADITQPERFHTAEADGCELDGIFGSREFDFSFSNSTIDHVGGTGRQEAFARQIQRIGRGYWVQTPSDRFPIEAHTGVPFYWQLPDTFRRCMHRRWQERLPEWYRMLSGTCVLSARRMRELFPDGEIYRERRFAFEKSYALYRRYR